MKIRDKLFLGFGLVSLTALGIGVMSVVNVERVNQRALKIYDEALMIVSFSKSATIDFYKIEGLYQQVASMTSDEREEHLELIEDETEVFFEDLDVVKERSADPRIHEILPMVNEHFQQWKTQKDQWLANVSEVVKDEESEPSIPESLEQPSSSTDVAEARAQVEDDLSSIVDFATESGFTMRVESEEQGKTMLTLTMVATGLAFLFGGLVAWITARPIVRRVNQVGEILEDVAQGDFSAQSDVKTQDEIGTMSIHLNKMSNNIAKVIGEVRETAEQVSAASTQISAGNEDLSQRTSEQASALAETSSSMEEITSIVKQNAENAQHANQLALTARQVAEKGGAVTDRAIGAMEEINKSSKKIADIINVIDEIAFQTNLLALNAAVEAARAGEQGRGFAVVAAEVRSLAQRSAVSAKEIKGLIHESVEKVTDGSQLVNESGKTLEEIVNSVKRVTDIIAEISVASEQQTGGIEQVNESILKMDGTTQQNAALVEEVSASAQSMRAQASFLMEQINFFKLTGEQELVESVLDETTPTSQVRDNSTNQGGSLPVQKQKKGDASTLKKEFASIGAGNGHARRKRAKDTFEEF